MNETTLVEEKLRNIALAYGPETGDSITESGQAKEMVFQTLNEAANELGRLRVLVDRLLDAWPVGEFVPADVFKEPTEG